MIGVLDASTMVSAALKAGSVPEQALLLLISPPNRLILSEQVADEYYDVMHRPKFDRYVSQRHRSFILDIVLTAGEWIENPPPVRACGDPKDDKYLALAAAGHADVIVSSDIHHLLVMHPRRGINIVKPADFLAMSKL